MSLPSRKRFYLSIQHCQACGIHLGQDQIRLQGKPLLPGCGSFRQGQAHLELQWHPQGFQQGRSQEGLLPISGIPDRSMPPKCSEQPQCGAGVQRSNKRSWISPWEHLWEGGGCSSRQWGSWQIGSLLFGFNGNIKLPSLGLWNQIWLWNFQADH